MQINVRYELISICIYYFIPNVKTERTNEINATFILGGCAGLILSNKIHLHFK